MTSATHNTNSPIGTGKVRDHWRQQASDLARLDCELVGLLPMTEPRAGLGQLPPDVFAALSRKLPEFVDWACKQDVPGAAARRQSVLKALAESIWRFVKTLKPDLTPFGDC